MAIKQTITLFDKAPEITQKKYVAKVSNKVISVKHAPQDSNPKTMEEFMKVAKQYWEFGVDVKQRLGRSFIITPYRCLFSSQKLAEETRDMIEQTQTNRNIKIAMEEYKKSKWKDEADRWGEDYKDEEDDVEQTNQGDINENQF